MKFNLIFLLMLSMGLSACSHIKVVGFDKRANTISIQGGKWDSQEDIQKKAEEYCGGSVSLLGMGEKTVGAYTSAQVYGNSGSATTTGINRTVYTYSCDNKK